MDGRPRAGCAYAHLPRPAALNLNNIIERRIFRMSFSRCGRARPHPFGHPYAVRAEREVILLDDVINSPQLLMLSGTGDPDTLRAHGIAAAMPLIQIEIQATLESPRGRRSCGERGGRSRDASRQSRPCPRSLHDSK